MSALSNVWNVYSNAADHLDKAARRLIQTSALMFDVLQNEDLFLAVLAGVNAER